MAKVHDPLGSTPARLLCLLRAHLAALGSSAHSQEEAGPSLGAQPLPRVLERAASKAADFTALAIQAWAHSGRSRTSTPASSTTCTLCTSSTLSPARRSYSRCRSSSTPSNPNPNPTPTPSPAPNQELVDKLMADDMQRFGGGSAAGAIAIVGAAALL